MTKTYATLGLTVQSMPSTAVWTSGKVFPSLKRPSKFFQPAEQALFVRVFSASEGKRKASEERETRATGEGAEEKC